MKNIKTKKGELFTDQLLIGVGLMSLGVIFILLSFIKALAICFITLGVAAIWTSWYEVYYCVNCKSRHGEYPYNKCEKCGGRKFNHKSK